MPTRLPSILAVVAVALAGCGGHSGGETAAGATTPMPSTLPGVYAGRFPCSNCSAIVATLWLREDGRFFLRQVLSDEDTTNATKRDAPAYALGQWRWDEHAAEAVLAGAGPDRRLAVDAARQLRLLVASPTPHLLLRDPAAPPFTDRLTLDGESSVTEKGATFRECLTSLQLGVADAGAYRELRRQHRRLNPRGKVALTRVEGHLATATDGETTSEVLVVDRVVTLKPGTPC
jgi:hypothetical protein